MRFLVDAQLPPALARWLGERSLSATPARESGLRESDDGSIWNFATAGGWTVIITGEDPEHGVENFNEARAPKGQQHTSLGQRPRFTPQLFPSPERAEQCPFLLCRPFRA